MDDNITIQLLFSDVPINLEKQLLQLLQERETDKVLKERRTLINQLKSIVNKETHLTSLNMTVYQPLTLNFLQLQVHVHT